MVTKPLVHPTLGKLPAQTLEACTEFLQDVCTAYYVCSKVGALRGEASGLIMQVWQEYELAPLRALIEEEDLGGVDSPDGPCPVEGAFAPPKLLWRSIVASMQGLRFGGGPPVGQDQFAQLPLPHLQPPGALFPTKYTCTSHRRN